MGDYILSHDVGTSSVKAVLVDFQGKVIGTRSAAYPTYYPEPAWVEQDPSDYWNAICETSRGILEQCGIRKEEIRGIVFSTQAQGVIPVDSEGEPLYRNITWVDGRAQAQAEKIMRKVGGKRIFTLIAGTPIMGKDCIAKITWLKEECPEIYAKTYKILDVNGYLKFRATGRMVTELSGASSYGLDLKKKEWMSVFPLVGIDMDRLPELVKSTDIVGGLTKEAAEETGLMEGMPVFGGCDDVQAAAVGSGMCRDGDIHIYLGTSAWVCASTRTKDKFCHGAAAIQSADPEMNLIAGITESAGANIQWVRDQFFRQEKLEYGDKVYDYMDHIVEQIPPGSDHLICTPWMLGERCPVSSVETRATLFNMTLVHTREHMMRAVYEGIGYNLRWILENYEKDYGFRCDDFRIIGAGALDHSWMQIIADITGKRFDVVEDPRNAGAVGAAMIALIGLGEIPDFASTKDFVRVVEHYSPDPKNRAVYDKLFRDYKNIYYSLRGAYRKANSARFEGSEIEEDFPSGSGRKGPSLGKRLRSAAGGLRKNAKGGGSSASDVPQTDGAPQTNGVPARVTEVIAKYARMMTELDYSVGDSPCILVKHEGRCYATRSAADFHSITEKDIADITELDIAEKDVLMASSGRSAMILSRPPYAAEYIDRGEEIPVALDDLAQIIGPRVRNVIRSRRRIADALRTSEAVLVYGGDLITCGRTLYEAYVALTVLEKSAEVTRKADVIGGAKVLPYPTAMLMHVVYRLKYSKKEEAHKDASEG
ncbi:MAG: FGGY family carbohydrate kinase [Anaerovoracaceae bacterium]|jgi:xylulokinase